MTAKPWYEQWRFTRKPDGRELGARDVDARRVAPRRRDDSVARDGVDDGVLERLHELARRQRAPLEIQHDVRHELAGAVIRDLPAAVDLHDGNVAGREQWLRSARMPSV